MQFVVHPNGKDGPCNTDDIRIRFWIDVLKSLELSYGLIFEKARLRNKTVKEWDKEQAILDLEERIEGVKRSAGISGKELK